MTNEQLAVYVQKIANRLHDMIETADSVLGDTVERNTEIRYTGDNIFLHNYPGLARLSDSDKNKFAEFPTTAKVLDDLRNLEAELYNDVQTLLPTPIDK